MAPTNTQKQQELFPDLAIVEKRKGRFFRAFKFNKPIFPQHRLSFSISYEVLIIILIGLVLVASVIFSLGVERGRNLEFPEPAITTTTQDIIVSTTSVPVVPAKEATIPKAATVTSESKPFTIQVASYKTRNFAEKEAAVLKAKGYSADIIKKGNYFILCVGAYAKKESARQAISDLSRSYKGCYIRKR